MRLNHKCFGLVFLWALLLSACGGGGQDQGNAAADRGGSDDQFMAYVQQLSATTPETAEPEDVTSLAASAPENTEPLN